MLLRIGLGNWALLNMHVGLEIPENMWRELGILAYMAQEAGGEDSMVKSIGVINTGYINSLEHGASITLRDAEQYRRYAEKTLSSASELLSLTARDIMPNPASGHCSSCEVAECQFSPMYQSVGEQVIS